MSYEEEQNSYDEWLEDEEEVEEEASEEFADEESESTTNQNEEEESNKTMIVSKEKAAFTPVTIVFKSEAELHDVIAALAAYSKKLSSVSGTGIKEEFGLKAYSGNARATVRALLPELVAAL